jgi:hypothetical protein
VSDNLQLTELADDIGSAGRCNAQPVRETRPSDCKILFPVMRGSSRKSPDDQEAPALMLTAERNERLELKLRSGRASLSVCFSMVRSLLLFLREIAWAPGNFHGRTGPKWGNSV